jgi:hypothetical protein
MNIELKEKQLLKVKTINKRFFEQIPRVNLRGVAEIPPVDAILGVAHGYAFLFTKENKVFWFHEIDFIQLKRDAGQELAAIHEEIEQFDQIFLD